MILPTIYDMLICMEQTIVNTVEPDLKSHKGLSATATIKHMLRQSALRLEHEGAFLVEDIARQRVLIRRIADYLSGAGDPIGATVAEALDAIPGAPEGYPTLSALSEIGVALRNQFHDGLKALQALRDSRADDADYAALRADIRTYAEWQIGEETKLIGPASFGQGPRR
ncbi:hypothetical protein SAMN02927924_00371 [Sphingobium faniae]|nr:hypothetical protein SAMN02927924_00371 [Sphingobium faniae]